jgi:hypothetical protein
MGEEIAPVMSQLAGKYAPTDPLVVCATSTNAGVVRQLMIAVGIVIRSGPDVHPLVNVRYHGVLEDLVGYVLELCIVELVRVAS